MGFTGDTEIFEGEYGFWKYTGVPEWNAENVLKDLGTKWTHEIGIKQYPFIRPGAGAVDNFIEIIEKNKLRPEDIEKVKAVVMPSSATSKVMRENKLITLGDFIYNIPYAIACAAYRIDPSRWLDPEIRQDAKIREFMKRVKLVCDEKEFGLSMLEHPAASHNFFEAEVVAKGETFKAQSTIPKGDPKPGFRNTDEEIIEKFKNNVSRLLPLDNANKVVQNVFELDKLENVAKIMQNF